jgi:hypothetical protein
MIAELEKVKALQSPEVDFSNANRLVGCCRVIKLNLSLNSMASQLSEGRRYGLRYETEEGVVVQSWYSSLRSDQLVTIRDLRERQTIIRGGDQKRWEEWKTVLSCSVDRIYKFCRIEMQA